MAYDNAQSDSNYYSLDESLMKFPILFVFVQLNLHELCARCKE